jgi:hypothetical protein
MARTQNEIAVRVLKKLGRLPDGQVAPASHTKIVKNEYTDLYQELLDDGIVNWSASDNIPNNVARYITVILLGRCSDDFGVPDKWTILEPFMKKKIAAMVASPYTPQPTKYDEL